MTMFERKKKSTTIEIFTVHKWLKKCCDFDRHTYSYVKKKKTRTTNAAACNRYFRAMFMIKSEIWRGETYCKQINGSESNDQLN